MVGQYLSDMPFVLYIRLGGEDGKINKVHQHNFDDIGAAHAKFNEALGWKGVVEVELTMVLKRVRPARKQGWTNKTPPVVERAELPEQKRGARHAADAQLARFTMRK